MSKFDNLKEIPPVNDSIFHCQSTKNIQIFKICRLFLFCYFSWKDTSLGCNVMKDPLERCLLLATDGTSHFASLGITSYLILLVNVV